MTYVPPDPSTYEIPSAPRRAVRAALYLVPSLVLYVLVPVLGLSELGRYGIATQYSLGLVVLAGVALAVLGAAASYARPTAAYGPLGIAGSVGAILYLLYLAGRSTVTLHFAGTAGISLGYGSLLTALAIVPAIRIGSGLLTTIEDVYRPGERLPFDFPASDRVPPAPTGSSPA